MTQHLDKEEKAVLEILNGHIGEENAINAGIVGKQLKIPQNATHVTVRGIISRIIDKTDIPIGANSNGFFIIKNADELVRYAEALVRRSQEIDHRRIKVDSNFRQYFKVKPLSISDEDEE